jgi:Xaa-Pro aminopeptidase
MRTYGLDVLIAASPVNITYFTDFHCWIDPLFKEYMMSPGAPSHLMQYYAVFPLEGEPALVMAPIAMANTLDLWVKDLHTFGPSGLDFSLPPQPLAEPLKRIYDVFNATPTHATSTDALAHILAERNLSDAVIGLDMEGLTAPAHQLLPAALPQAQLKDAPNLIRLLRAVKTQDEIERLRAAAAISETAVLESLAQVQAGQSTHELVNQYRARVAAAGADLDHFIFGIRGMGFATEPNHILSAEDIFEIDYGCIYQHCFSDSGTTVAMRPLTDPLAQRHATLYQCIQAATDRIAPGIKSSVIQEAMVSTLEAGGITASFPHGHGLGLEVRDYPIIVPDNGLRLKDECIDVPSDLPLETNMVINLEASIRLPSVGSLHIEVSYQVTDTGYEPLVPQQRAEPVLL